MPENANLHWTEDDNLLARYVLGRLTEEERRNLEVHLHSCVHCKEVVRKEQELVSGIRRYGRDEVKSRLKRRLTAQPDSYRTLITWQRALSAAAVLLVVAGLGIYNQWFTWGERKSPSVTEEMQEPQKELAERDHEASQKKEEEMTNAGQQAPLNASRDAEALEKPRTEQTQGVPSSVSATKTQVDQNAGMNKLENAAAAPSSGGAQISMNKDIGNAQDRIKMAQPDMTEFWVEGRVLQGQSQSAKQHLLLDKRNTAEENAPRSKKLVEQNDIKIDQRNVQFLPLARRKQQQQIGQTIQASVQQSDGRTRMTIYLDTLFNEQDLLNARVQKILSDSLVLEVKSQKIGFKMPVNFNEFQEGGQKSKEK